MKLKPKFGRVLLEREKLKSSTIIIPDGADKRNAHAFGKVVAVGPTCDESIAVGTTVIIGKFAGDWIKTPDGREMYIVQDEDVLAEVSGG